MSIEEWGGNRKGSGRPPKPESEKKKTVVIRVLPELIPAIENLLQVSTTILSAIIQSEDKTFMGDYTSFSSMAVIYAKSLISEVDKNV